MLRAGTNMWSRIIPKVLVTHGASKLTPKWHSQCGNQQERFQHVDLLLPQHPSFDASSAKHVQVHSTADMHIAG